MKVLKSARFADNVVLNLVLYVVYYRALMVYAIENIEENEMKMFRFSVFILLVLLPQLVFGISGGIEIYDAKIIIDENKKLYAEFPVILSATPLGDIKVKYSTSDGTAKQGKDYLKVNGVASIPSQHISTTIKVPLLNKSNVKAQTQKNFYMTISSDDAPVFSKKAEAKIEPQLLIETSKGDNHESK